MRRKMLNFTVGPVQSSKEICALGAEQIPYFRTAEFSKVMLENERFMLQFSHAPTNSRAVFLTGSGTASMEAAVLNTLTSTDKVLIVNGGSFGQRFVEICKTYHITYDEIKLSFGHAVSPSDLSLYQGKDYTAFLVNIHETSTGVRYDMDLISHFCRENNLFLIVDAISSFLADPLDMDTSGVDVMLTGSQKALACPPGVSIMVLSPKALGRISQCQNPCYYLNLQAALKNGERGQTPFTPAVGILLQINARLRAIEAAGGANTEIRKVALLAQDFRNRIKELPFEIVSESLSNAVTPLHPKNVSAYQLFLTLKEQYNIWICPNGGELKDKVLRVGHIGDLTLADNEQLIMAFKDLRKKGLL